MKNLNQKASCTAAARPFYVVRGALCLAILLVCASSFGQSWPARYDDANLDDQANAVAVDHQGNVIVVGTVTNESEDKDAFCISYSPTGTVNWSKRYANSDDGDDFGTGVAVDWQGNVYMCGVTTTGGSRNRDFFVKKMRHSDGDTAWPNSGSGYGFDFDNGAIRLSDESEDGVDVHDSAKRKCAIAIIDEPGSQPNFAITGPTDSGNGDSRWRTVLFQDDGFGAVEIAPGWPVDQFGDIEDEDDQPNAVAIYSDSSVYVTGGVHSSNATENFTTIRYYSAGGGADPFYYWIKTLAPLSGKPGEGTAIALDKDGNAYATGYLHDSAGNDYATLKILKDPDGFDPVTPWTNEYSA